MREERYLPAPLITTDYFLMYLIEEIQLLREEVSKLKEPEAPAKTRRKKDAEGV